LILKIIVPTCDRYIRHNPYKSCQEFHVLGRTPLHLFHLTLSIPPHLECLVSCQ
jgi:hypothetical protein